MTHKLALFLALALAACAPSQAAQPPVSPQPSAQEITAQETEAVRAIVTGVAHHIDGRDWDQLRALYADQVETDYTSLFGGTVQKNPGDALIAGWKSLLSPIVTQHLLGPVHVTIDGESAEARCHVRGYHFAEKAPGGPTWMVAGHYIFRLQKTPQADSSTDGAWKITHMTLETYYQTGNTKLLQEAATPAG